MNRVRERRSDRKSSGRLFYMEMMIVLLFFGIASAVILRTFAASDRISRESGRLERMSFCAQSAAEIYSCTGSLSAAAEQLFGAKAEETDSVTLPLDGKCGYAPGAADIYLTMRVKETSGGFSRIEILFTDKNGMELYSIESGAYIAPAGEE